MRNFNYISILNQDIVTVTLHIIYAVIYNIQYDTIYNIYLY